MGQAPGTSSGVGGWLRRFVFRFGAIYLVLYTPLLAINGHYSHVALDWLDRLYTRPWLSVVPWVGRVVLGIDRPIPFVVVASDHLFNWVQVLAMVLIALAGGLGWVWFDRARRWDGVVRDLVGIGVRYTLALTMLGYGIAKVLHQQMWPPDMSRLMETYGEVGPRNLLWTFMGQSGAYSAFAGALEMVGGLLLLSRRTTALGALVTAAVMSNVVMMNLFFDVAVKLFSMHLLALAIMLAVPVLRPLADVLVLGRPASPPRLERTWTTPRVERLLRMLKPFVVGLVLWAGLEWQLKQWMDTPAPVKSELYGLWIVEGFVVDGVELSPLLTDTTRWRQVGVDMGPLDHTEVTVHLMNDTRRGFVMRVAEAQGTLTLQDADNPKAPSEAFTFARPSPNQLVLDGQLGGKTLSIRLVRADDRKLRLRNQPFRWIRQ